MYAHEQSVQAHAAWAQREAKRLQDAAYQLERDAQTAAENAEAYVDRVTNRGAIRDLTRKVERVQATLNEMENAAADGQ